MAAFRRSASPAGARTSGLIISIAALLFIDKGASVLPAPCDSVLAESLEHIGVVLALRPRHIDISELIVAEIIVFGI